MRIPAPLLERPIESVIAGLLLMALLFVTAGSEPAAVPVSNTQTIAEKM